MTDDMLSLRAIGFLLLIGASALIGMGGDRGPRPATCGRTMTRRPLWLRHCLLANSFFLSNSG